jgi:hypothetical protein
MERKREEKEKRKQSIVQEKIKEGMKSSKFRFLNEQLYSTHSSEAVKLFKDNKDLFNDVTI